MAVTQYHANFDRLYTRGESTKVTINKLVDSNLENLSDEAVINSIMTTYDTDVFSSVPKCKCDENPMMGNFLEGVTCPICGEAVAKQFEGIESELWLKSVLIDGYEMKFMSPIVYRNLSIILTGKKKTYPSFNYLDWLMDTMMSIPEVYKLGPNAELAYDILEQVMEGERGYKKLVEKYVDVLKFISQSAKAKKNLRQKALAMIELYNGDGYDRIAGTHDGIFTTYFPILSNKIFVMENNAKGKFANLKSSMSLGIVKNWINLCKEIKNQEKLGTRPITTDRVGNIIARIVKTSSDLFQDIYKTEISQKPGLSRKHIYGSRCMFSFRGLIVGKVGSKRMSLRNHPVYGDMTKLTTMEDLQKAHELNPIDVISIPWKVAVAAFDLHLNRMLLQRGYSVRDARKILDATMTEYNPEVHELLDQIKADFGGKIPVIAIRNPTLLRGSLMLMYVNEISTDLNDNTIGINPLVIKVFNGDFDGDQMSFMILLDQYMVDLMEGFRLKYALYSVKRACGIEDFLGSLSTGNQVIGNFLRDVIENPEDDSLYDLVLGK